MTTTNTLVEVSEYSAPSGANPAVSAAGRSRVYYDLLQTALLHSDNGGAYAPFGPNFGTSDITTTGNLLLGADPADTGRIRLSNGDIIAWEASPAGGDIGISVNAAEQLLLGAAGTLPSATIFDVAAAGTYTFRVNNVDVFALDASGNLLLGADPADTGRIRLSNADTIAWEASPAGADVVGISVDATEQLLLGVAGNLPSATILDVAAAGSYTLRVNNVDEYIFSATSFNLGTNLMIQGTTPSTTGDFRVKQNWGLKGRNSINTGDVRIAEFGVAAADIVELGDGAAGTRIYANATIRTYIVATERFRIGSVSIDLNNGTSANYAILGNAEVVIGFNIAAAGVRNVAFFNDGSTGMNSMDGGLFILNAVVVPVGNPTAGGYLYATGGAGTWRGSGGTVTTFGPS